MMARQLALNVSLRDASSFDNFWALGNEELLARVRSASTSPQLPVTLWGEAGTGKTHLLEAACRASHDAGGSPVFVPLGARRELAPAILDDLEHASLVCVDDLHAVAQDDEWELALLSLYERRHHVRASLLFGARQSPEHLPFKLADLRSRLQAGWVYPLKSLDDLQKIAALQLRAHQRGLELPDDVARYVLTRHPRDMHALFAWLERVDAEALAAQRRLTIPFLRSLDTKSDS